MIRALAHRWAGDDIKASEKTEKHVKDFFKAEKLPFLIFQLPSKDLGLNCK